jgi:hypothetical protein
MPPGGPMNYYLVAVAMMRVIKQAFSPNMIITPGWYCRMLNLLSPIEKPVSGLA